MMEMCQDSSEKLRTEILTEARNKSEEIIVRAKHEAEALLTMASAEAGRVEQELIAKAHAEAKRQSALILATVSVEAGKLRAARVEELLEVVHEEVSRIFQAREGFDYSKAVISLASHAIRQMAGDAFVVRISDKDRALLGEDFTEEVSSEVGRPIRITVLFEENVFSGGVVIEDEEARQVWDNRILRRLERMWPEMQRQIAKRMTQVLETGAIGGEP